jgi:hypothetical protein
MTDAIEGSQKELLNTAFSGTEKADSDGSKQFKELWAEENMRKRSELAVKICNAEKEYNKHLKDIVQIFLTPLKSAASSAYPILPLEDIHVIFPELEAMYKSHAR